MVAFPTTLTPLTSSTRTPVQKMINSGFENGTGQSRKKNTRPRYEYKLDFQATTLSAYMQYETFFNTNKGDTISFIDPIDGTTRYGKMIEDSITADFS